MSSNPPSCKLPLELLLQISDYLETDIATFSALSQTCRTLHTFLSPFLDAYLLHHAQIALTDAPYSNSASLWAVGGLETRRRLRSTSIPGREGGTGGGDRRAAGEEIRAPGGRRWWGSDWRRGLKPRSGIWRAVSGRIRRRL